MSNRAVTMRLCRSDRRLAKGWSYLSTEISHYDESGFTVLAGGLYIKELRTQTHNANHFTANDQTQRRISWNVGDAPWLSFSCND